MTRRSLLACLSMLVVGLPAQALPPDARHAETITRLRSIGERLRVGKIDEQDRIVLQDAVDSGEPVLVAATAWLVGEFADVSDPLLQKLLILRKQGPGMSSAFVRIALEKSEARRRGEHWRPEIPSRSEDNRYYLVEATRVLLRESPEDGRIALNRLVAVGTPMMQAAARRIMSGKHPVPDVRLGLQDDDSYGVLVWIIKGASPE